MKLPQWPIEWTAGLCVALAALCVAFWQVAASYVFVLGMWGIGVGTHLPSRWYFAWWEFLPYHAVSEVQQWLWIGGLSPFICVGAALLLFKPRLRGFRPGVTRGITNNHDNADWATVQEMAARFPGRAGKVVGEALRIDQMAAADVRFNERDKATWGKGGKAPLLVDDCSTGPHSLIFCGTRGGKTMRAISTGIMWPSSCFWMDPARELSPMLTGVRQQLGHRVFTLDPSDSRYGTNVCSWIKPRDRMAGPNVDATVSWVFPESSPQMAGKSSSERDFFYSQAKLLATAVLADALWDTRLPARFKNLSTLRSAVTLPKADLKDRLAWIGVNSQSQFAADVARSMEITSDTFDGIYSNANLCTSWLSTRAYSDLVCGDSYDVSELAGGKLSVFCAIPYKTLYNAPAVCRTLVGAHMNAMYEAGSDVNGYVGFELEEAARLGYMNVIKQALGVGGKHRVALTAYYQSVGQIEEQWGINGKRDWYEAVAYRTYSSVKDDATAKDVSEGFGTYTAKTWNEGKNAGRSGGFSRVGNRSTGTSENTGEMSRKLITPYQVKQARRDELFVFASDVRPMRCSAAFYYRRPEFAKLIPNSRYFRKVAA